LSVTGCVSQVPYPVVENFDPTTPGVCAEFEALVVPDTDADVDFTTGEEEGEATMTPPIVSVMLATDLGDEDASIYERRFGNGGLPKLKGTHNDTVTDLPLRLQRELTIVSDGMTAAGKGVKTYKVRVQRVVLVCVRSFYFVCVCFMYVSFFFF
jgi:hypothetical protein